MSLSCASASFQCILDLPACPGVILCHTPSTSLPPAGVDFPGVCWLVSSMSLPFPSPDPPHSPLLPSSLGLVLSLLSIPIFSIGFPMRVSFFETFSLWFLPLLCLESTFLDPDPPSQHLSPFGPHSSSHSPTSCLPSHKEVKKSLDFSQGCPSPRLPPPPSSCLVLLPFSLKG